MSVNSYNYMKTEKTTNEYITSGYNYDYYQLKFEQLIDVLLEKNLKVAAVANFLKYEFPKIPYFWGGGHEAQSYDYFLGLNPTWGNNEKIVYEGSDLQPQGSIFPKSLDCSGFVTWCLVNAGFDVSSYVGDGKYCLDSKDCRNLGVAHPITEYGLINIIKPGDVAWMSGHVGVVTEVNVTNNTVTIVHVSGTGKGINATVMNLETGLVIDDDLGPMPEGSHTNRVGDKYFTHFISVNY